MRRFRLGRFVLALIMAAALMSFLPASASAAIPDECGGKAVTIYAQGPGRTTWGTPGNDVIMGTNGTDIIKGRGGNDFICGIGGNDTLEGNAGNDRLFGGSHVDVLKGGPGDDTLWGGGGADVLRGNEGSDILNGEVGNDELWGGGGWDRLNGGAGNDRLHGEAVADTMRGGDGDDYLDGGDGDDKLYGDGNNDRMFGGAGTDTFQGGTGNDTCTDTNLFRSGETVCETTLGSGSTAYIVDSARICYSSGETLGVRISNDNNATRRFRVTLRNSEAIFTSPSAEVNVTAKNSALVTLRIHDGSYTLQLTELVQYQPPRTIMTIPVISSCGKPQLAKDGYVALGDSYSSGFGMGSYESGTFSSVGEGNNCQRSAHAYAHMVQRAWPQLDLNFRACQGGTSTDFYQRRDLREPGASWGELPQLDHLSSNTILATLTIGGNDARFASILETCIKRRTGTTCAEDPTINAQLGAAFRALQNNVYPTLFSDIRGRAPHAIVVVLGYPALYDADASDSGLLTARKDDQKWIRAKTQEMNAIIEGAVRNRSGFVFVDTMDAFAGHELSADRVDDWFYRVGHPGLMHPTPAGHDAMGQEVINALMRNSRFSALR